MLWSGEAPVEGFPHASGCQLPAASKPLCTPRSGGRAHSSKLENEAGLGLRAQNKFSRPTAFLKQKGKHDDKTEKHNQKSWQGDKPSQTSFNLIYRSYSGAF